MWICKGRVLEVDGTLGDIESRRQDSNATKVGIK